MVCAYCGNETAVVNSRLQKQINKVWRRRQCFKCQAIFSTLEHIVYENTFVIQDKMLRLMPFQREKLFISVYESCKHRPQAITDASALTDTVIGKLQKHQGVDMGVLSRDIIIKTTREVLNKFDNSAFVYYSAFHEL